MNSLLGDVMSTLTEQMGIDMKAELQSSPGVMNDMKKLMAANMGKQPTPFTYHSLTYHKNNYHTYFPNLPSLTFSFLILRLAELSKNMADLDNESQVSSYLSKYSLCQWNKSH